MDLAVGLVDALGRPIEEGDELILNGRAVQLYQALRIEAPVDPRVPATMLKILLRSDVAFVSARGQRNPEFLLVRTREERQALERAAAEAAERAAGARS